MFKPETKDLRAPREVVTLPGVSVRKLGLVDIQATDGSYLGSDVIALLPDGQLYRAGIVGGTPQLIRTGVADFALRNEVYTTRGPLGTEIRRHATTLYIALGHPITLPGGGSLIGHDLTPGARTEFVEFNAGAGFRITSVAVDASRIFVTRTPASGQANSGLLRRYAPAEPTIRNPGEPDYTSITLVLREYRSLRSTGRMVYFAHANTIQRISVDAPRIDLDYEAFGLEVTQGIQSLNNTVPLVAGKPTLVRGYARLAANSTRLTSFPVPAQLRVYHAPKVDIGQAVPVEVEGSPFLPVHEPPVAPMSTLQSMRNNPNATFRFEIPERVVRAGNLLFEFILNDGLVVPETGLNPLANNRAVARLKAEDIDYPVLVFAPMMYGGSHYDYRAHGSDFWDIIARARTLLPVAGFRVYFRADRVTKPVVTFTGIKARSFDLPENEDAALMWLSIARTFDSNPLNSHYVGMFPPEVPNWNGLGYTPGHSLIIRMGTETNVTPSYNIRGGVSLAHELAHNFNFRHVATATNCTSQSPKGPFDAIPGDPNGCTMGATDLNDPAASAGFDFISGTVVQPSANGDLMSYATNRWTSEYNWRRMYDLFVASQAAGKSMGPPGGGTRGPVHLAGGDPSLLIAHGMIDTTEPGAELVSVHLLPAAMFSVDTINQLTDLPPNLPPDHPLRLQLLDSAGAVLVDQPCPTEPSSETGRAAFRRGLWMNPAGRVLRLVAGATTLVERPISESAPTLTLAAPEITDGQLALAWSAADADGDPLRFTVQFSPDDGQTWQTLRVDTPETSAAVDTTELPGGPAARVRVIATDGARSTVATSGPFPLPKHAPWMKITGVRDGAQFDYGAAVFATGFGYDNEDGSLPDGVLQWTLLGPERRHGTGANFSLANLPPGVHTLTLTGTDSDGAPGSETLRFVIRALGVAEGAEPVLDGLCADPGYAVTPPLRLAAGEGNYVSAQFTHANGALFACFTGLRYGGPNSPGGAVAGLRIDPGSSGAAVAATVGFAVNEHGHPLRVAGDGSHFVSLETPPPGFSVVILRDENAWSAEMRIADDLLGGWQGRFGLVVFNDVGNAATPPATWPPGSSIDLPSSWALGQGGPPAPIQADGNLLPFGDAEGLAGGNGSAPVALPGWTVSGRLTIVRWNTGNGYPVASDPGPADRGVNFFSGGPDSDRTTATIRIELPVNPARIDAGQLVAALSGWFGGFQGQDDFAALKATFLSAAGMELDSIRIGGFTATPRQGRTALLFDEVIRPIPAGARQVEVVLEMKRAAGVGFNDGYADNLSLILHDAASVTPPNLPPVAKAGAWQTRRVNGGERVALDGSDSRDPEGAPLVYTWRQVSGPALTFSEGATARPAFTAPAVGASTTFTFELVVNDGVQDSAPATTRVTLNPPDLIERELVTNGGFENTEGTFVMDANKLMSLPVGSKAIPGWTTIGGELAWSSNDNPFGPKTPEGALFLDLTGYHDAVPYGGVEQTIATTPDHTYKLSLSVGLNHDVGALHGPMIVAVVVAARTNTFTLIPDPAPVDNVWGRFTNSFVAGTVSTRIAITGTSARGGAYLGLDDVSLAPKGGGEELLVNGSFEDLEMTFTPDPNGVRSLAPGSTVIPGWTTLDAELVWGSNTNPFGAKATDGSFLLDLTGYHDLPPYGGVAQQVATTPGQPYELSFALGAYQSTSTYRAPVTVAVAVDSETHSFTLAPPGVGNQWGTFTMSFTATSNQTPIAILGMVSTGGGYIGLDQVSVVETGIAPPHKEVRLDPPVITGTDLILSFMGAGGRNYSVESRNSFSEGSWTLIPGLTAAGTDGLVELIIRSAFTEPQRFFRIREVP